jgi:hypothetical protein
LLYGILQLQKKILRDKKIYRIWNTPTKGL